MGVPQFTTPTFTLIFEDENLDLTAAQNVYVTFKSGKAEITKRTYDLSISEKEIGVYLTQSETGKFQTGRVEIQANWTSGNGSRCASNVAVYDVTEQLLKRVVE